MRTINLSGDDVEAITLKVADRKWVKVEAYEIGRGDIFKVYTNLEEGRVHEETYEADSGTYNSGGDLLINVRES